MKYIYVLFIILIFSINSSYSQGIPCTDGTQASCKCSTAEVICSTDLLDNYTVKLTEYKHEDDGPSPICPINGGGSVQNPVWFAFIAWCEDLDLKFNSKDCSIVGGQTGIQVSVLAECDSEEPIACEGICLEEITLSLKDLIIGKKYYCIIDGCAGSVCEIEIDVLNKCETPVLGIWQDSILGLELICNYTSSLNTYTISKPVGATSLQWYVDSVSVYTGFNNYMKINWNNYSIGVHEICVHAYSEGCTSEIDSLPPKCLKVNIIEGTLNHLLENNNPGCIGDSLYLKASGGDNYSWHGPLGFDSNNPENIIKDLNSYNSGNYIVTITNSLGCVVLDTVSVLIKNKPQYNIVTQHFMCSNFCLGKISVYGSDDYNYLWSNLETDSLLINLCPGTYYVSISNGNCNTFDSAKIKGTFSFDLSILVGDTTLTAQVTGGQAPFTYFWNTTNENDSIISKSTGYFCVEVYDANGCHKMVCDEIVSSNSAQTQNLFEIYPNPTSELINIIYSSAIKPKIMHFMMLDEQGGELLKYNYLKDVINVKHLSAGVYFIVVEYEGGRFVRKFLKL